MAHLPAGLGLAQGSAIDAFVIDTFALDTKGHQNLGLARLCLR